MSAVVELVSDEELELAALFKHGPFELLWSIFFDAPINYSTIASRVSEA